MFVAERLLIKLKCHVTGTNKNLAPGGIFGAERTGDYAPVSLAAWIGSGMEFLH